MSGNNVHIPDDPLSEMNAAAQAQGKTADDLVTEATRLNLEHKALDDVAARGRAHAERAGRSASDAVTAVRDLRRGRYVRRVTLSRRARRNATFAFSGSASGRGTLASGLGGNPWRCLPPN